MRPLLIKEWIIKFFAVQSRFVIKSWLQIRIDRLFYYSIKVIWS